MIKNIKKIFYIASAIIFGSVFLLNCEPEADTLGEQFFTGIQGKEVSYDVIGYNISNNDSIKSDVSKLLMAPLGAFSENVFGTQKASYVTQVRMATYDPDFGGNAVVDSAVLVLQPLYVSDSATTVTDEAYVYPEGNVAAKKEIKSYPVKKYGKRKINGNPVLFNIRVHEVTDFLGGSSDSYYSNKTVSYNTLLGTKLFNGNVSSAKITKDTDNSVIFSNDVSLRINLDKTFFQNKIIAKQGSIDLKDAAGFIRHFKGIRISVDENDGYIMTFSPQSAEIIMYYKYDKVENGTTTRTQTNFKFPLGAGSVRIGQFEYNRTGSVLANSSAPNIDSGDQKLFPQGMGGPSVGVKIPQSTIDELKSKFTNEKAAIISAKIRVYTDTELWNNTYEKPSTFTILKKDATAMLADIAALSGAPNFNLVKSYDLDKNPAYYDFSITKSLKDIVETEEQNKPFIINIGSFLTDTNGQYLGYDKTTRSYTPHRVVLVGSDNDNPNRIQLKVTYGSR